MAILLQETTKISQQLKTFLLQFVTNIIMAKTSLEYKLELSKAKRVLGVPSDISLDSLSKEELCQHFIDCVKAKQVQVRHHLPITFDLRF